MNEAKLKAIEKLYDRIAKGEQLSENEWQFLHNTEETIKIEEYLARKQNNQLNIDNLLKNGNKALSFIDKVFPSK